METYNIPELVKLVNLLMDWKVNNPLDEGFICPRCYQVYPTDEGCSCDNDD